MTFNKCCHISYYPTQHNQQQYLTYGRRVNAMDVKKAKIRRDCKSEAQNHRGITVREDDRTGKKIACGIKKI